MTTYLPASANYEPTSEPKIITKLVKERRLRGTFTSRLYRTVEGEDSVKRLSNSGEDETALLLKPVPKLAASPVK